MPQCVTLATVGGQEVLVPAYTDPCTSAVVLYPTEYAAIAASPFHLSPSDGLLISGAVIAVWAAAFGARALVRALNVHGFDEKEDL